MWRGPEVVQFVPGRKDIERKRMTDWREQKTTLRSRKNKRLEMQLFMRRVWGNDKLQNSKRKIQLQWVGPLGKMCYSRMQAERPLEAEGI